MDRDFRQEAALLRTLGHHTRLAIIEALQAGPTCVSQVQELLDIPQPNISQHLALLRREGIVDSYEEGKRRCYYLARSAMAEALRRFLETPYPITPPDRTRACRVPRREDP